MKKKHIIRIIIAIFILLCVPIRMQRVNDGGSVEYRAVLYCVWDRKIMFTNIKGTSWYLPSVEENAEGYLRGIEIEVFGIMVYSKLRFEEW